MELLSLLAVIVCASIYIFCKIFIEAQEIRNVREHAHNKVTSVDLVAFGVILIGVFLGFIWGNTLLGASAVALGIILFLVIAFKFQNKT